MSTRYTPILGTLVYIIDPEHDEVLLVHRTARADDEQFGMWNGLGGKLSADEDVVSGARREVLEEAGIELGEELRLRGTISWPGFGPNGEDWFGFVFVAGVSAVQRRAVPERNDEGSLHWVPLARVRSAVAENEAERLASGVQFYEGDRFFVPLVFDTDHRLFHGVMPYANGRPTSWSVVRT